MEIEDNKYRPVIIISPGRSGSTLMQRYLSASEEMIIWGEHGGFLRWVCKSYNHIVKDQRIQNLLLQGMVHSNLLLQSETPINVDIEWTNNFTKDDVRRAFQNLVLEILTIDVLPSVRWGFKEIRYGQSEIDFLKELFPESQFVFVVRHPIETLASMIAAWTHTQDVWKKKLWVEDKSKLVEIHNIIEDNCERIISIAESIKHCINNGIGFLVRYDDLKKHPFTLVQNVCSYLKVSPPFEEKIRMIASDYRWPTDTQDIKAALYGDFIDNKSIFRLINLYKDFDYHPME